MLSASVLLLGVACSAGGEGDGSDVNPSSEPPNSGGTGQVGAGTGGSGAGGISGTGSGANSAGGASGLSNNTGGSSALGQGGASTGTGGSGTAMGSGGTGAAGMGGTGAGPGAGCSAPGVFLCDDFEVAAAGVFPNGAQWVPNVCTSHQVDNTVAHTGSQSLRGGAEQYPACMAHVDVSAQSEIYARTWVRLGGPSSDSGHEIDFLEFGPTTADNPELRIGVRNNDSVCSPNISAGPGVEVTVDGFTGTGERTLCTGMALEAERWYCLQVHFVRSAGSIGFSVQIDGQSVVPETTYPDAAAAWNQGPMFFKLGRSSYGGNNVWPAWHDDVALSTSPIGCQ